MGNDRVSEGDDQGTAGDERGGRARYRPPEEYAYGPIPGVPEEVMRCMPPAGMVHEYVWWASQVTFANPIWHIASILPALAYDCAMQGWTFAGRGKQIALQSFLIGRSTAAKSTCLRLAKEFHEETIARERGASWSKGVQTPWIEAEGTPAGMLEVLHDHYRDEQDLTPAILFHEEVDGLLSMRDPAMVRTMMRLFDASPKVERQLAKYRQMAKEGKTPPNVVTMPAVSGVFCSTLSSMARVMTNSHFEGGLVSRSLWFVADPNLDHYADINDTNRWEQRRWVVERWAQYGPHLRNLRSHGAFRNVAPLSREVKEVLRERVNEPFKAMWKTDDEALAAQLQRADMQCKVIASVFAVSQGSLIVSVEDMHAAINLIEWSIRSVGRLSGHTADEAHWRSRQIVLDAAERGGAAGVDRSRLYKVLRCAKGDLDHILDSLVDEGVIVPCQRQTKGRKGTTYKTVAWAKTGGGQVVQLHRAASDDDDGIVHD